MELESQDRDRSYGIAVDQGPSPAPLIKSAARVLRIFDFFDEVQREAKVHEIAERLNFPQSSTSVLLKCLMQLGYLDYDAETRTFLPSPRVALLGTWLDKGPVRNGSLIRMMEELSNNTGDTIILAARNGIYSQYIRVIQSRSPMRFHVPQGSRRLVVWSATGFVLLSGENKKLIQSLCLRTNAEAERGQPLIQLKSVQANISQLRRTGYFISKGLVTPGAGSIAMPLPKGIDQRDRPFAIAVSGPLSDISARESSIVELMRDAIGRYLGNRI